MRQQPLIIGAGPAGCAAAIRLRAAGHHALLLERASGPGDKVCGDFLSADAVRLSRALGVDPAALGAAPIERVRLVHRDRCIEAALPFAAYGLSRRRFDAALQCRAEAIGAELRRGEAVRRLQRDGAAWQVRTEGAAPVQAATVFLATGKHDLRDVPRDQRGRDRAVGMKMYYRPPAALFRALEGVTELTLFPGGYAGVQPVEDGRVVLCLAVRPGVLKARDGWAGILADLRVRNRGLARLLADAEPLLSRPLAVAGIPYGYQADGMIQDGLFRIGDQGAVIPSLTGDGMAIALHSGTSAAQAWHEGITAAAWQTGMAGRLAAQMRLAGVMHQVALNALAQDAGFGIAAMFPGLLRMLARRTRLRAA